MAPDTAPTGDQDRVTDSAATDEPEVFTIERGPSIYMDGTGDFYIRRPDRPGILATVVLPLGWKDKGR